MKQIVYDENFHRRVLHSGKEVPQRSSKKIPQACPTKPMTKSKPRRRLRIMPLLIGIVIMLLLLCGSFGLARPMVASAFAQWQSGEDRLKAFHLDVGHGKRPSEFLTQYKDGQAIIIEFPGGNFSGARVYTFAVSERDTTQRIVTLQVASFPVGNPHLFVLVEGFAPYVLYNTGETFSHTLVEPKKEAGKQ